MLGDYQTRRPGWGLGELEDGGMDAAVLDIEEAEGAEAGALVVGEGRAAGVDDEDALEGGDLGGVGAAADDDVDGAAEVVLHLAFEGAERRRLGELEVVDERTRHLRSLTAVARAATGGVIRAPMPGLVARVLVEPGSPVAAGAGVLVLEAMKMENELRTTAAGVVAAIRVSAGETVEKGQVLVELE